MIPPGGLVDARNMAPFLTGTTATLTSNTLTPLQPTSKDTALEGRKSALLKSIAAAKHEAQLFAQDSGANKATRYEVRSAAADLASTLE